MKGYFYNIIIAALCPLFFTACLTENPKGQIEESEAYNTSDDIERNLIGELYNYIVLQIVKACRVRLEACTIGTHFPLTNRCYQYAVAIGTMADFGSICIITRGHRAMQLFMTPGVICIRW